MTGPDDASQTDVDTAAQEADDLPTAHAQMSMITPMSHHGPVSLTVTPDPADANGYGLPDGMVTITGNCGTVHPFGSRTITEVRTFPWGAASETVVFAEVGAWSGPFTVVTHHPLRYATSLIAHYELDCTYGPSGPPHRVVTEAPPVTKSTLRTTVTYPNGVAVTGLTVRARDIDTGFERELTEGGNYTPGTYGGPVFSGTYLIEYYSADGDLLTFRAAEVADYEEQVRVDDVVLSFPPPGTVSGTVTWSDGLPVIDQQVTIAGTDSFGDPFPAESTRTDDDSTYEFPEVPAGDYTVRVLHDTHGWLALDTVTVDVGGDHVVDLVADLADPGAVTGRTTFSDGSPVVSDGTGPGNVELIDTSGTRYAHSDADGEVSFAGLAHGAYELRVAGTYMPGFDFTSDLIDVDVIPGHTATPDVVLTMPTGSVQGAVLSTVDGSPVANVVVSVASGGIDDTTGADGAFLLDGIEGAGTLFLIEVRTQDGVLLGVQEWEFLTLGEGAAVQIYVTPASALGTLNGTITWSNGTPLDDAEVRLTQMTGGASTLADVEPDGLYEFVGVTPGDYTIEVIVDGDTVADRDVTVTGGDATIEDFVLVLAGAIDGQARWADLSGPVEDVQVEITDGSVVHNDTSDAHGAFGFDNLTPGMWHLAATHDSDVIFSGPISVPDGLAVGVVLDVPVPVVGPDTGTVDGTVTWDDGTPVGSATVNLVPTGTSGAAASTTTNPDGTYELADAEVGDYLLQVVVDGDLAAEQAITVGADQTTTVNLVLTQSVSDGTNTATTTAGERDHVLPGADTSSPAHLPQTGPDAMTPALVLVGPLLLLLGMLALRTTGRARVDPHRASQPVKRG